MKNLILIIACFCLAIVSSNAQSLMDRVNKTKADANKPAQVAQPQNQGATHTTRPKTGGGKMQTVNFTSSNDYVNIQNKWKSTCIHIEYGNVDDTKLGESGWHSAQWSFTPAPGAPNYFVIKNKWKSSFLNIKNGLLASSNAVGPGSYSAHWEIISIPGSQYFKLKNRASGTYLHNENGSISHGEISPGWHSAQWKKSTIGSAPTDPSIITQYKNSTEMYFRYTDQVSGGRGLNLVVGSQIKVLPNQTVSTSEGLSFDPNNPKICGKTFTVATLTPHMKFTEPFPENMRNRNNSNFKFQVIKIK